MSEWVSKKIGDIANLYQGLAINAKTKHLLVTESSLPLLRIKDLLEGTKEQFVDPKLAPLQCVVEPNELVMTRTGQVGYVFMGKSGVLHNNCFKITVTDPEVDTRFLYWHFNSNAQRDYLTTIAAGSVQPDLNHKVFKDYDVLLPPLTEQKAIASVLSSLDDKIDLLHRQNKTLEAMAETLFRQWFIEEAKEDWVNVQLKDIVKQIKPGTNYQPKRLDSGIPFLNVRNLQNGQINLQGISFISQEEYERVHKAWKPEEGDVLISRIGTLGIVAVLGKRDMPMAVHYNMLVLKPSLTNTAFLYFFLRSQYFQEAYSSKARQSVQEYVAVEDAESIELKLPLNDAAFANKQDEFYCLFDKIRANLYQIQTLENLRDTLLPKLMSGEVRVQYQTEEVA